MAPPPSWFKPVASMFEYDTIKTVHIKSLKVGLIFRTLQLAIIGYIVGYVIVWDKGYQEIDTAVSSVITKIKGSAVTCNVSNVDLGDCALNASTTIRVWDSTDLVVPAQESNAFFITTNIVETIDQQRGSWPEDPDPSLTTGSSRTYECASNDDCPIFDISRNGVLTGNCDLPTNQRCEIYGWGPVEYKSEDRQAELPGYKNHMKAVTDFTVFVKNNIFFPRFNATFSNYDLDENSGTYLRSCIWDSSTDGGCPVFRVLDLLSAAQINEYESQCMIGGCVLAMELRYDCDLDKDTRRCAPSIGITRLDNPDDPLSPGYNFRYAHFYKLDNEETRSLYKTYGLRFIFIVSGQAGRFSPVPLLIAFGSGLGLLGLATVIADLLVTKVLSRREFYSSKKFEIVEEDGEEMHALSDHTPLLAKGKTHSGGDLDSSNGKHYETSGNSEA